MTTLNLSLGITGLTNVKASILSADRTQIWDGTELQTTFTTAKFTAGLVNLAEVETTDGSPVGLGDYAATLPEALEGEDLWVKIYDAGETPSPDDPLYGMIDDPCNVRKQPATIAAGDIAEDAIDAAAIKADAVAKIAAAMDGGSGSGARTLSIVVTDGTDPLEDARVRLRKGAGTVIAQTDADGICTLNVDDGTWTLACTLAGYQYDSATLDGEEIDDRSFVVAADHTLAIVLDAVALPASEPGYISGYYYCEEAGVGAKEGVVVYLRLTSGPDDGMAYDTAERTATSDAGGYAMFANLVPGASYIARRGRYATGVAFTIPADAETPYAMPTVAGTE